jgi:hypothetical protein
MVPVFSTTVILLIPLIAYDKVELAVPPVVPTVVSDLPPTIVNVPPLPLVPTLSHTPPVPPDPARFTPAVPDMPMFNALPIIV